MKYSELGFRPFYRKFAAIELNDDIKELCKNMHRVNEAELVLTYGFVDSEGEFKLQVLGLAKVNEDNDLLMGMPQEDINIVLSVDMIKDLEATFFKDTGCINEMYLSKVQAIPEEDCDEYVKGTRAFVFLDKFRDSVKPDIVSVALTDGKTEEVCKVQIVDYTNDFIVGKLINRPENKFKLKKNANIYMKMTSFEEDGKCVSLVDSKHLREYESYENGQDIKDIIDSFRKIKDEEAAAKVFLCLSDSYVWVPCNAIINKISEDMFGAVIDASKNMKDLAGRDTTPKSPVKFVPDVFKRGEEYYIPVFTNKNETQAYGDKLSIVQYRFVDVIKMALNLGRKVDGIVVNPFTDNFPVVEKVYQTIAMFAAHPGIKDFLLHEDE